MPGSRVATEWHLKQSPTMRDSPLTLPLLASLRDPTITSHQALCPPYILHSHTHTRTHTHTHPDTHIACWAIAQGVYVLPPRAKWSDRSKHCWYKQAWIRVLWWHARGTDGRMWGGQSRYVQTMDISLYSPHLFTPVCPQITSREKCQSCWSTAACS